VKILMVTGAIPHDGASSGASLVMAGQVRATAARHDVTLVTFAPGNHAEQNALSRWRASGVTVHAAGECIPPGLVQAKRRLAKALHRLRQPASGLDPARGTARMQALVNRVLDRGRFELLHAESIGVGHYRYQTPIPKVLTEHEVGRQLSDDPDQWRTSQPVIWRPFDRVQVFTGRDAALLTDVAPDMAGRVRVNPFGIDLPSPAPADQEDQEAVVFVGSFNHVPNVEAAGWFVSEIMPVLRARQPAACLWLVGEDPPAAVRRLAGADIVVTGAVPTVAPYLRRAAVVVAPVRTGGGMRRKVLEAMAAGKSVVSTSLGAEGLGAMSDQAPLVCADSAAEFGEAVARLLESPSERRALGQRARAYVGASYSWSAYADRLDAVYAELCSR
jgi:glycosyltransferase involved in cell wall biosynthesis